MAGEKRKSGIQQLEGEEQGRAPPASKSVKRQESVEGSVFRGEEGHHQHAADPEMEAAMRKARLDTLKNLPRADNVARLFGMAGQCAPRISRGGGLYLLSVSMWERRMVMCAAGEICADDGGRKGEK